MPVLLQSCPWHRPVLSFDVANFGNILGTSGQKGNKKKMLLRSEVKHASENKILRL